MRRPDYAVTAQQYHAHRTLLLDKLGNVCTVCGDGDIASLIICPIQPRDWEAKATNSLQRLDAYDAELDKLQLLCWRCHLLDIRTTPTLRYTQRCGK